MMKLSLIFKKMSTMFSLSDPCANRQNAITLSNLRVKSAIIKIIEIIMETMRYIFLSK